MESMNAAHIHLMLNHFPIILLIVGFIILIIGMIIKMKSIKITALVIFMAGSLITIPTYISGGAAEEVIESATIPNIEEKYIEKHEKDAKIFSILFYFLCAISFIGIYGIAKELKYANWFNWVIILFSAFTIFFAIQTGNSGGEIRHTEIRKEIPTNGIERQPKEVGN